MYSGAWKVQEGGGTFGGGRESQNQAQPDEGIAEAQAQARVHPKGHTFAKVMKTEMFEINNVGNIACRRVMLQGSLFSAPYAAAGPRTESVLEPHNNRVKPVSAVRANKSHAPPLPNKQ